MVTYTGCRDDVAGGLTKVLWTASQLDELSDFEDLLDAIRLLRPRWNGANTVLAWRYVRRQAWVDALRVLEDDDAEGKRSALHAALVAVCLFGMEDPLWHSYAITAASQGESAEASLIGNRLLEQAAKTGDHVQAATPSVEAGRASPAAHDMSSAASSMMWVRA
jgi:type III secretion protein HrpB1